MSIKQVFGEHARKIPEAGQKATRASARWRPAQSGAICALALTAMVPPTIIIKSRSACDLNVVPNHGRAAQLTYVMSNSFGFGASRVRGSGDSLDSARVSLLAIALAMANFLDSTRAAQPAHNRSRFDETPNHARRRVRTQIIPQANPAIPARAAHGSSFRHALRSRRDSREQNLRDFPLAKFSRRVYCAPRVSPLNCRRWRLLVTRTPGNKRTIASTSTTGIAPLGQYIITDGNFRSTRCSITR